MVSATESSWSNQFVWESFFLARGSFGPEIFVSEFFWRQSPGFLALQVKGLLANIVTVLVIVPR